MLCGHHLLVPRCSVLISHLHFPRPHRANVALCSVHVYQIRQYILLVLRLRNGVVHSLCYMALNGTMTSEEWHK
jgi:hypothetical protein